MRSVAIPVTPESTDLRQSNELLDTAVGRRSLLRTGFDGEPGKYRDYPTCSQAAWGRMAASQTLDHQSRSGVRQKKTTARHASLLWHSAADGKLATLLKCGGAESANRTCTVGVNRTSHYGGLELSADKNDPDPKALACYGMLSADTGRMHLRFVSGRPVSQVTTDFLEWLCEQVQAQGKGVLVLIWDNASWHVSKQVKTWLCEHNQTVLQ